MAIVNPIKLLDTLIAMPRETEWLEFKVNKFEKDTVGRYISALANSAMLHSEDKGYLIFGVEDGTHNVVGTSIDLKAEKVGAEPFEAWLARMLHPALHFQIVPFEYDRKPVQMVVIDPAYMSPVRFQTEAYIRVDSVVKPLRDYPERERALWSITSRFTFEQGIAAANLSLVDVFERFDPERLLKRLGSQRLSHEAMASQMLAEGLLVDDKQGGFDATNLLALLAARDIRDFPPLAKKTPRVITYVGTSKIQGSDERSGLLGYGNGFSGLLSYIMGKIPHKEEMVHGTRRTVYAMPEISIREFVVNALIHQDLTQLGSGPVIEIFADRVKITNPGRSLMDPHRLIDTPARSRNERLAAFMRRLGYCEERGSGVDRAVDAIEKAALRAPLFQAVGDSMVVTVYGAQPFGVMTKEDRIRACYQHACVRWEANTPMSNQSLRDRFGLGERQYPQVSLVIKDAIEAGEIRPLDAAQGNRNARYVPGWAT